MPISVCKSDYFTERSRIIIQKCIEENAGNYNNGNFYSPAFLDVFLLSATCLEAFINERVAISLEIIERRLALNDPVNVPTINEDSRYLKIIRRMKREQHVKSKYLNLPQQLWYRTYDKYRSPYSDFETLVDIRNDIVHYNMPFYEQANQAPTWVEKLSAVDIFMPNPIIVPPVPIKGENGRVWIEEICTLKGAKWAHNTSCAMVKQFFRMSEGIIKFTIGEYVNYFKEL
jgi:hypothetical protein